MAETDVNTSIPEALGDEDGERYYLQGHVDPPLAVLAVVVMQAELVGDKEAIDVLGPSDGRTWRRGLRESAATALERVHHNWSKPDPNDADRFLLCDKDDPAAGAWTTVDLF